MAKTLKISDGDIVISSATGVAATISGNDLVKQHIAENLTLDRQPNGTGAGIKQLIGNLADDSIAMNILLRDRLSSSFNAIRSLQNQAPRSVYTNNELINGIKSLIVQRINNDPRNWFYRAVIMTEAGAALSVTDTIQR